MGKGKKKRSTGQAATSWEAVGAAMLATLGNTLGQLIADGAEHVMSRRSTPGGGANGATTPPPVPQTAQTGRDVAADLLQRLDAQGERSVADLACACNTGLTETLDALRSAREFGLVEFDQTGGTVRLTDAGRRTVAALTGKSESPIEREEHMENAEAHPE
jgi:hypothetical protein